MVQSSWGTTVSAILESECMKIQREYLTGVKHVLKLKKNLIFLSGLNLVGCQYTSKRWSFEDSLRCPNDSERT